MPMPVPDVSSPPFQVVLRRLDTKPDGSFRPGARIELTPALRTSGLLTTLPGEDLKNLLLMLTFVHPNGHVVPSLMELSQALRQPMGRTAAQLHRLERFLWQGGPAVYELRRGSGLHAYAPSPRILGTWIEPEGSRASLAPPLRAAGRETVIALSRNSYARPRREVEAEIAHLNGWERREADEAPEAKALRLLGVSVWQAQDLLERCGPERIRRQLAWLPYRHARDPARYAVAAILNDYGPPPQAQHLPTPSADADSSTTTPAP